MGLGEEEGQGGWQHGIENSWPPGNREVPGGEQSMEYPALTAVLGRDIDAHEAEQARLVLHVQGVLGASQDVGLA